MSPEPISNKDKNKSTFSEEARDLISAVSSSALEGAKFATEDVARLLLENSIKEKEHFAIIFELQELGVLKDE